MDPYDGSYQPQGGNDGVQDNDGPRPHPYLHDPQLYITNLPPFVNDEALAVAFVTCGPFRPKINRDVPDVNGAVGGTIEFRFLEKAEKALATLQSRPIPGVHPPVQLILSPYPPTNPPTPLPPPSASPRLVKHLPLHITDSELYDLFRPFGSLASVRVHTHFGPDTGVVEFFDEDEARIAEEAMHCTEVDGMNIAVQVYQPRRVVSSPSVDAPNFVPSAVMYSPPLQYSPPYAIRPQLTGPAPFVHGPGQQVQLAPQSGPGSNSHSGLIDPCNLFCKNLDPDLDSNKLFSHFKRFGQIVSARVMRNENGESRGFGFVSFQTPEQANAAMAAMNNAVIGSKQIVVRLHEPKQLRQEKLAARYSGGQPGSHPASPQRNSPRSNPHSPRLGYNGHHPRNSSGATSPTISEGGESVSYGHGWGSPRASMSAIGSPMGLGLTYSTPERGRRGSGSYYNAAVSNTLNFPLNYNSLSSLTPVVRNEVVSGTLTRKVKALDIIPSGDVDAVVERIIASNLPLSEVIGLLQEDDDLGRENDAKLLDKIEDVRRQLGIELSINPTSDTVPSSQSQSRSASAASQDSRLLAAATASAPEHPSTPISVTGSISTPPRTSSPSGSVAPLGEKDRVRAAISKLEKDAGKLESLTELIMSLPKKDRAMCLFNNEILRVKVAEAREVLESGDDDEVPAPAPASVKTPPRASAVATSPPAAAPTPPPATGPTHTLPSISRLPAAEALRLLTGPASASILASLSLTAPDPLVRQATDEFIDGLLDKPVTAQKQQVGEKLFKVVKSFGIKAAPKITVALLDQEDLRALAHLMNSYPAVLKEKASNVGK